MARQKKRKANFEEFESISANSRYYRITKSMRDSKAWQQLDVYDIVVYHEFKAKYNGKKENSRDLSLTYAEMKRLMSKDRFKKSLDRLIEVGLIDLVKHRPHNRDATIYGLSTRWHCYGTPEFKEQKRAVLERSRGETGWQE